MIEYTLDKFDNFPISGGINVNWLIDKCLHEWLCYSNDKFVKFPISGGIEDILLTDKFLN